MITSPSRIVARCHKTIISPMLILKSCAESPPVRFTRLPCHRPQLYDGRSEAAGHRDTPRRRACFAPMRSALIRDGTPRYARCCRYDAQPVDGCLSRPCIQARGGAQSFAWRRRQSPSEHYRMRASADSRRSAGVRCKERACAAKSEVQVMKSAPLRRHEHILMRKDIYAQRMMASRRKARRSTCRFTIFSTPLFESRYRTHVMFRFLYPAGAVVHVFNPHAKSVQYGELRVAMLPSVIV